MATYHYGIRTHADQHRCGIKHYAIEAPNKTCALFDIRERHDVTLGRIAYCDRHKPGMKTGQFSQLAQKEQTMQQTINTVDEILDFAKRYFDFDYEAFRDGGLTAICLMQFDLHRRVMKAWGGLAEEEQETAELAVAYVQQQLLARIKQGC